MTRSVEDWLEDVEAILELGVRRYVYLRFIYRHHMRSIHKRGRHAMKHYGPMFPDGGEFDKCDWCGHLENIVPARTPLMDHLASGTTQHHANHRSGE